MACKRSLVNYESSSDSDIEVQKPPAKRLPLPDVLKPSRLQEVEDDPSAHDGRVRSFAHERGIWSTYVYIPIDKTDALAELCTEIKNFLPEMSLNPIKDFHISLTKTVVLRHHWIDSITKSIKTRLKDVRRMTICLDEIKIYANEEKTRTFIGVEVSIDNTFNLKLIVAILDSVLLEFKLPEFYEKPSFHVSILWCLGDETEKLNSKHAEINEICRRILIEESDDYIVPTPQLHCKIGNKLYIFNLL